MAEYHELTHAQQADMLYTRGQIASPSEHDFCKATDYQENQNGGTIATYTYIDGTSVIEAVGPGYTEVYAADGNKMKAA